MKHVLFFMAISLVSLSNAQVWSDNFDDEDVSDWTLIDSDGDGFDWSAVQVTDANSNPVGTPVLRSASWNSLFGALTPDNWAISPAIDLTSYSTEGITLNYQVQALDADWDLENYTVYVATGNTISDFTSSSYSFSETTLDGVNTLADRSLDISGLAGNTVYVAFRHYGVTDQFTMSVDNVSVDVETLGTVDIESSNKKTSSVYPNPATDVVNVNLSSKFNAETTKVEIINLVGKKVSETTSVEEINVSNLPSGVYVLKITDGKNTETKKLIKK